MHQNPTIFASSDLWFGETAKVILLNKLRSRTVILSVPNN